MKKIKPELLKRVLLIHTGGTFGMAAADPIIPAPQSKEFLQAVLSQIPELGGVANLDLKVVCNIDSSDMSPAIWLALANVIVDEWDGYDGFVIIHGTDTMAYTAAALSFCLHSLTKSIVLTGSQRPLSELRTDARANLIDAVELATTGIPEVMICFDSRIHRGTRATKVSNEHLQAFEGFNTEPLGNFGVHLNINKRIARKPFPELSRPHPVCDVRVNSHVTCLTAVPGLVITDSLIDAITTQSKGIIIRAFGTGNLPLIEPSWQKLCRKAAASKIPVVMNTQCLAGRVDLNAYENGRVFRDCGMVSSFDMSFEATVVKLMVMLGRNIAFEKRFEFFETPLANECAPTNFINMHDEPRGGE